MSCRENFLLRQIRKDEVKVTSKKGAKSALFCNTILFAFVYLFVYWKRKSTFNLLVIPFPLVDDSLYLIQFLYKVSIFKVTKYE